jgi:hypothetical protein
MDQDLEQFIADAIASRLVWRAVQDGANRWEEVQSSQAAYLFDVIRQRCAEDPAQKVQIVAEVRGALAALAGNPWAKPALDDLLAAIDTAQPERPASIPPPDPTSLFVADLRTAVGEAPAIFAEKLGAHLSRQSDEFARRFAQELCDRLCECLNPAIFAKTLAEALNNRTK